MLSSSRQGCANGGTPQPQVTKWGRGRAETQAGPWPQVPCVCPEGPRLRRAPRARSRAEVTALFTEQVLWFG